MSDQNLDLSPEEIHQVGLDEVEKIEAKIEKIKESLGFEGTLAEFRKYFLPNAFNEGWAKNRALADFILIVAVLPHADHLS